MCNCDQCQVLIALDEVRSSLFYVKHMQGDGLISYYKYPNDDEKELVYQEGLQAGYKFLYNELVGYKSLE